jgi:L-rhamnose mutarotase
LFSYVRKHFRATHPFCYDSTQDTRALRGAPNETGSTPLARALIVSRRCFALDLADDAELIAEYERLHGPGEVWPKVIEHIRATGVESMEIWRTDDRLLMITEVSEDYPRRVEPPPEVERWEELMWRFQRPVPHAAEGEKWMPMTRIFSLDEQ